MSVEKFKANRESLNRQNQEMTLEARADFWSIICRHHNDLRAHFHVPKEDSCLVSLKYIDVTRLTYTDLDVFEEED